MLVLDGERLGERHQRRVHIAEVIGDPGQGPIGALRRQRGLVVDHYPLVNRQVVEHRHLLRAHGRNTPHLLRAEPADVDISPHADVSVVEQQVSDVFMLTMHVTRAPCRDRGRP
jgi:hypothetical protein